MSENGQSFEAAFVLQCSGWSSTRTCFNVFDQEDRVFQLIEPSGEKRFSNVKRSYAGFEDTDVCTLGWKKTFASEDRKTTQISSQETLTFKGDPNSERFRRVFEVPNPRVKIQIRRCTGAFVTDVLYYTASVLVHFLIGSQEVLVVYKEFKEFFWILLCLSKDAVSSAALEALREAADTLSPKAASSEPQHSGYPTPSTPSAALIGRSALTLTCSTCVPHCVPLLNTRLRWLGGCTNLDGK